MTRPTMSNDFQKKFKIVSGKCLTPGRGNENMYIYFRKSRGEAVARLYRFALSIANREDVDYFSLYLYDVALIDKSVKGMLHHFDTFCSLQAAHNAIEKELLQGASSIGKSGNNG
jgi:hypothetical protein